jgi:hypothetical protein
MPRRPSWQRGTIRWALTREHPEGMRSDWWTAESSCVHGSSRHQLVGALATIRARIGRLSTIHRASLAGCDCLVSRIEVVDV